MISVIMPVTLEEYPGGAKNRENKFITAVNGFIDQCNITGHELIIVSDGCKKAEKVYNDLFSKHPNIVFELAPKQDKRFSGYIRHRGIQLAKNKIITYLDSDDYIGAYHLSAILKGFKRYREAQWLYWNEILDYPDQPAVKEVSVQFGSIGTSSIAHKKDAPASWLGCDGYGHDFTFISQLDITKSVKIEGTAYRIRHIPGIFES